MKAKIYVERDGLDKITHNVPFVACRQRWDGGMFKTEVFLDESDWIIKDTKKYNGYQRARCYPRNPDLTDEKAYMERVRERAGA